MININAVPRAGLCSMGQSHCGARKRNAMQKNCEKRIAINLQPCVHIPGEIEVSFGSLASYFFPKKTDDYKTVVRTRSCAVLISRIVHGMGRVPGSSFTVFLWCENRDNKRAGLLGAC
jgi:hypothetical protein